MRNLRTRRSIRAAAASVALACALVAAPLSGPSATASPYWTPVTNNCGSQYVELTITADSSGLVRVGYTNSTQGNYSNGAYWEFAAGTTSSRNPGYHSLTWQKWNSPGEATQWSYRCVSWA